MWPDAYRAGPVRCSPPPTPALIQLGLVCVARARARALTTQLGGMKHAVSMLHERIAWLQQYLAAVQAGKLAPNRSILVRLRAREAVVWSRPPACVARDVTALTAVCWPSPVRLRGRRRRRRRRRLGCGRIAGGLCALLAAADHGSGGLLRGLQRHAAGDLPLLHHPVCELDQRAARPILSRGPLPPPEPPPKPPPNPPPNSQTANRPKSGTPWGATDGARQMGRDRWGAIDGARKDEQTTESEGGLLPR